MPTDTKANAPSDHDGNDATQMAKYGITRKPVDYFYVNSYRYTDLKDAVAQAKRLVGSK